MNLLFMCVANSARSQLAEGLAKKMLGTQVHVESAGSAPSTVNPLAIQVLKEVGIGIAQNRSKSVQDLSPSFIQSLDFVITLCKEEICPMLPTGATRLHWPLPDPASNEGDKETQLERFRETREAIAAHLKDFAKQNGFSLRK